VLVVTDIKYFLTVELDEIRSHVRQYNLENFFFNIIVTFFYIFSKIQFITLVLLFPLIWVGRHLPALYSTFQLYIHLHELYIHFT